MNGTWQMLISPTQKVNVWSISAATVCTWSPYSIPVHARMTLAELRPHLHTLPEQPAVIPYRTSYYRPTWGFCLSQCQLDDLPDGEYEVCIDSTLRPGSLTYGELLLPGELEDEVLISTHVCHPSLANDNLSGMLLAAFLGTRTGRLAAPLFVSFSIHPRDDRLDYMAGTA